MPDRFATAVWVNPAAIRQSLTFFAKCNTSLFLLGLEVWRGFSAISHSAYQASWTVERLATPQSEVASKNTDSPRPSYS
jgi:hypothetical protein